MEQLTDMEHTQVLTRRTFLRQVLGLTGASAGAALLVACGATSNTAAPTTAQLTVSATNAPVLTTVSTEAAASTAAPSATTTGVSVAQVTAAATSSADQDATDAIIAAANAFLATLSATEKSTGVFDWSNTAQKQRWSNFPPAGFTRAGLKWGDLSTTVQSAWLPVMQATLSAEGYKRVMEEWAADDALLAAQGTGGGFGKANYYIAVIGTPSATTPWQWQFGGHHLAINATVVGSNLALVPSFLGVQPGSYTDAAGATVVPLGDIKDDAFALMSMLDTTQRQAAVLGTTVIDLVLGPGQDGKTIASEGLPVSQMTADQQTAFLKLVRHYTGLGNDAYTAARMAQVQSTLDQTYFAWYGPVTEDSAAYFRVTGPTIVIEFSPQGDPQGDRTPTDAHIHGIYRDPTNDYGAKYTGISITS